MLQNLRRVLRGLLKQPAYALVAVLVLGIGIGVVTLGFSVVQGVFLRPLAFENPERLVWAWATNERTSSNSVSGPDYLDYREADAFASLAVHHVFSDGRIVTGGSEPERVLGSSVSANLFSTLGVTPSLGRGFVSSEERPGSGAVVVISHGFWTRRFGEDPGAVGRPLLIDGQPWTVVGVMPRSFDYPAGIDLWFPIQLDDRGFLNRDSRDYFVIGRLAPDVPLQTAQAQVDTIASRLAAAYPDVNEQWGLRLERLHDRFLGYLRPAMQLLIVTVFLVLLVACANVSSLALARASGRSRDQAVRLALGASRLHLVREALYESFTIAVAGSILGVGLAAGGLELLKLYGAASLPRLESITIDLPTLSLVAFVTGVSGVVFGLVPVLRSGSRGLVEALSGTRATSSAAGLHPRRLLVVAQLTLSLVLLVCAGLFVRSFLFLQGVDPGARLEGVIIADVQAPVFRLQDEAGVARFYAELHDAIGAVPGIEASGGVEHLPFVDGGAWNYVHPRERPPTTPDERLAGQRRRASQGYFEAMGIPIHAGRSFEVSDRFGGPPVVVISEAMADEFWPGESAIGQRLTLPWTEDGIHLEVIGIAGDVREFGPRYEPPAVFYLSDQQFPIGAQSLAIRTSGDASAIVGVLRQTLRAFDPDVVVSRITLLETRLAGAIAEQHFQAVVLSLLAVIALVLASIGLYGVLVYLVGLRTREFGIRVALGARTGDVLRLVLWQGLKLVLTGLAVGTGAALVAARFMASLLYGVKPADPWTFGAIALLLITVALAASLIPARRATRLDPVTALRAE
ncbi:MAG: ABC transporter permease [Dehalococcoidia bacterium]|jgi:predicted permease|nr:ABC transporter permease [Dehalococcoidia bacterium]